MTGWNSWLMAGCKTWYCINDEKRKVQFLDDFQVVYCFFATFLNIFTIDKLLIDEPPQYKWIFYHTKTHKPGDSGVYMCVIFLFLFCLNEEFQSIYTIG